MAGFIFMAVWGAFCFICILLFGRYKTFEYILAAMLFSIGFTPLIGIPITNQLYK